MRFLGILLATTALHAHEFTLEHTTPQPQPNKTVSRAQIREEIAEYASKILPASCDALHDQAKLLKQKESTSCCVVIADTMEDIANVQEILMDMLSAMVQNDKQSCWMHMSRNELRNACTILHDIADQIETHGCICADTKNKKTAATAREKQTWWNQTYQHLDDLTAPKAAKA